MAVPPPQYFASPPGFGVPPGYGVPPSSGPPKGKGMAITALVVGIVALLLSWVPVFALILGLIAVVFGAVGISRSIKGMSIAGLILGVVAMLINVIVVIAVAAAPDTPATVTPARTIAVAPPVNEPSAAAPATTEAAVDPVEPSAEPTVEATTEAPPATPDYTTPKPRDFTLSVKNKSKQCFGSAGCNIEYRVKVSLKSGVTLDPDMSYDVTFDVLGGEDGAVTGTFTVEEGGTYSGFDLEGFVGTSSSGKKLTAKVTDVEEA